MMLHIKYEGAGPFGFRQQDFLYFPILAYVKHVTLGWALFGPMVMN